MKIVFDTNVLISAFLTAAGTSQYVVLRAFKRHQVILSSYIIEELQEKLTRKLGVPENAVREMVDFLKRRAVILEPVPEHILFKDTKDVPILQLAALSGVQYLVTGDKALLQLKRQGMCAIISPREAMEYL